MATTGVQTLDRRYIGERTDDEELQYLNARYYNNGQGQFLSQDPVFWEIALSIEGIRSLRSPQVMNSYSYAANNPILYKDPTGRQYVDYNGGYTTPWGIGVTGGVQDSTSGADSVFYVGVTISRPGPSGSVTYSPDGNPSEGWGVSGNITYGPVTGQLSRDENGNWDAAGGVGIPGGGVSVTHGFTRRRAANFLFGSPVNNETTVMTTGAQPVSSGGGKFYIPLNTSSGSTKSNNAKNKTNSKSSGYAEVSSYIAAGMAAARRGDTASAKKYADEAQKKLNKN